MKRMAIIIPLGIALAACGAIPEGSQRQTIRRSTSTPVRVATPETRQCMAELGQQRAAFTPVQDKYYGGGCSTLGSVRLASLKSDGAQLGIANLGPVTCPVAQAFASWARYGVDRAARQILGSPLAQIETMGSYSCRNVAGSSRRSAHATASAIDVSGFVLADGRRITLTGDWTGGSDKERRFLRVVQASACKRFGTVLGPQYNSAHRDHFHLEAGSGSFCR